MNLKVLRLLTYLKMFTFKSVNCRSIYSCKQKYKFKTEIKLNFNLGPAQQTN